MSQRRGISANVLVVGGAGYIGSHTCKQLRAAGYVPVVYDNLGRGSRDLVRFGPLYEGDILDSARLDSVLAEVRPIGCLHFAAFAYVEESQQNPEIYYRNNVAGSISLFAALRRAGVGRLVFSSTCAVYGAPSVMPISEHTRREPISVYGKSKAMVEDILTGLDAAYGLRSVSLRYFNAAGADPEGELGELHFPEPHIIPRLIMAAMGRINQFDILGDDYPTSDGTAVRDYIHVQDLASAHVCALQYLLDGGKTETINLGIGRGYTVGEVIREVERIGQCRVPINIAPRRHGDPAAVVADSSRAATVLGFKPRYRSLDDMVRSSWNWYSQHGFRSA